MNEIGKSPHFNLAKWIDAIEMMILSDEVETALYMIDHPPGWWRDNKAPELIEIKKTLMRRTFDVFGYANYEDLSDPDKAAMGIHAEDVQTRAQVLGEAIKKLNQEIKIPFVYEIGPGPGWLPLGMQKLELKFNYFAQTLNNKAIDFLATFVKGWREKPEPDQKTMFVCYEILEHLWRPDDIEHWALRSGMEFDYVFLSTPKYTCYWPDNNWREKHLGHLRTWTPNEFLVFADKTFKNYKWTLYDGPSMVLKGER